MIFFDFSRGGKEVYGGEVPCQGPPSTVSSRRLIRGTPSGGSVSQGGQCDERPSHRLTPPHHHLIPSHRLISPRHLTSPPHRTASYHLIASPHPHSHSHR